MVDYTFEKFQNMFGAPENDKLQNEYEDVFVSATETLFRILENAENKITIEGVEWPDSYVPKSVVYFHIKETPGWKYGIWWEPIVDEMATIKASWFRKKIKYKYVKGSVLGKVFGQYEDEIDKFNPSRSEFVESVKYCDGEFVFGDVVGVEDMISFIHNEPYLAYYKDMNYTDFNREYVRRDTAKKFFEKQTAFRKEDRELEKELEDGCKEKIKKIFDEQIENGDAFILDAGKNCRPRYSVCMKLDGNYESKSKTGYITLEELVEEEEVSEESVNEYKEWLKEKRQEASDKGHYLFSPFAEFISIYHPDIWVYYRDEIGNED